MKVRVSPDFCSTGLWGEDDGMIEFNEIDLPADLIKEIKSWIDFYDEECHDDDFNFKDDGVDIELNDRGRRIARKIKLLHPEIEVEYFGEIADDMLNPEPIN